MIFISYSHGDTEFINNLSSQLPNRHIKVWDEYKLLPGASLTSRISDALDKVVSLLIVISNNSIKSQIDKGLLQARKDIGFTIIPMLIDDIEIPKKINEYLWIVFRRNFELGFSHLIASINSKIIENNALSVTTQNDRYFFYYTMALVFTVWE